MAAPKHAARLLCKRGELYNTKEKDKGMLQ